MKKKIKKLKGKTKIETLFKKGKRVQNNYLTLLFYNKEKIDNSLYVGVSVPKRKVYLAVRRNKIKRQLRQIIKENEEQLLKFNKMESIIIIAKKENVNQEKLNTSFLKLLTSIC